MLWIELVMFFNPNVIYNRVRKRNVKYDAFFGAEIPKPIITFLLETSWTTSEVSRKRY